jgi:branched-chain amino acid transport system ATP-binding protein
MMGHFLEIHDLHAWYGTSHVLHGIDYAIDSHETIGLLGRNGMGKSTLIRSILGHVQKREGQILINGQSSLKLAAYQVAQLGLAYVPEGRGVFPNLTVKENLLMCAKPGRRGQQDWTFDRVMATFPRLSERLKNLGEQLSGGEQQMLSIGRALMTHPDLLILDEATEGLAPLIVAEIWHVIQEIRTSGMATLIVDRDWRKVLNNTDRALVLQKGKVVLSGTSKEVLEHPELTKYLGI